MVGYYLVANLGLTMGFFLTSVDTKRREPVESDFSIRVATVRWSGEAGVLMKTEQAGEENGITFEAASR